MKFVKPFLFVALVAMVDGLRIPDLLDLICSVYESQGIDSAIQNILCLDKYRYIRFNTRESLQQVLLRCTQTSSIFQGLPNACSGKGGFSNYTVKRCIYESGPEGDLYPGTILLPCPVDFQEGDCPECL